MLQNLEQEVSYKLPMAQLLEMLAPQVYPSSSSGSSLRKTSLPSSRPRLLRRSHSCSCSSSPAFCTNCKRLPTNCENGTAKRCSKVGRCRPWAVRRARKDRKSTRLNSSHQIISYAVFCLKKKKRTQEKVTNGRRILR